MAGPALPVNVDATYTNSGTDPSVQLHQAHHDLIHTVVNKFDKDAVPAAGQLLSFDGVLWQPAATSAHSHDADPVSLVTYTGTRSLVIGDAGKFVEMNLVSANSLTVPPNSSVSFAIGTTITVGQLGAGQTTLVAGGSGTVLLRSRGGALKLAGQYAVCTLVKRATNEWWVSGDLTV